METIDLSAIGGERGREDTQKYPQELAASILCCMPDLPNRMWLDAGSGLCLSKDRINQRGFCCLTQDVAPELPVDFPSPVRDLRGSYGVVSAFDVLEHLPEPMVLPFLQELRRLSSRYIVLSVPLDTPSEYHFEVYSPERLLATTAGLGELVCGFDLYEGYIKKLDYSIGQPGAFASLLLYRKVL